MMDVWFEINAALLTFTACLSAATGVFEWRAWMFRKDWLR